jgi:hypothetical protein
MGAIGLASFMGDGGRLRSAFHGAFDAHDLLRRVGGVAGDRHALVDRTGRLVSYFTVMVVFRTGLDGLGIALGNRASAAAFAVGEDQGLRRRCWSR